MSDKKAFNCEVGARVSQLRIDKNYTRERLSELAGISDRFLYDIESGRKGCSAETLLGLSKALGTSADYLLTGETGSHWAKFPNLLAQLSRLPPNSIPYAHKMLENFAEYAEKKHKPKE